MIENIDNHEKISLSDDNAVTEIESSPAKESEPHTQSEPAKDEADALKTQMDSIESQHAAIRSMFGLDKTYAQRAQASKWAPKKTSGKTVGVFVALVALVALIVAGYTAASRMIDKKEEAEFLAKKQKEIEAKEARRNRIEYAEIAFMESLPQQVSISLDGKMQYAKTPDGTYTELRASKNTWIRYLPVKEDTVLSFSFEAEGFRPLTRKVAYYDWFPAHGSDITLQKVFRQVILEPDMSPRLPSCQGDACDWSVFREIMFRTKYAEMAKMAVIDDKELAHNRNRVLKTHPALMSAVGLDPTAPLPQDAALAPAAANLLHFIDKHPFDLYGTITIETDAPDTRVSFLGEPLMIVKDSGSMSQVKVEPDKPFTFSTYGQGHPIVITDPLSIRLEAQGYPSYVTEILPHQWHCTPISDDLLAQLTPPAFTQLEDTKADYRHYACDYSIRVKVNFAAIREISENTNKNPDKVEKETKSSEENKNDE